MSGIFMLAEDIESEALDWGVRRWHSLPNLTGAESLVVVEVEFMPGGGHNFHRHPNQEETIYVLSGEIEQWLETEKKILKAGDSAFISKNLVHASFNISDKPAKALAVLGPCVGSEGYELIDVSNEAPWNGLK